MNILYIGMDACDYGKKSRSHECYVAEDFCNLGHNVTFVVERMPIFQEGEKPGNLTIEVMSVNKAEFTFEEKEKLLKYNFDIVFASSISGLPHAIYLSKSKGKKCIVQVLDVPCWRLNQNPLYPKHWRQQWEIWCKQLEQVDKIVVNIPQTQELLQELNPNLKNFELIYYGISIAEADKIPEQDKGDFIIWISGIRFYKGLDLAIYALSLLPKEKRLPLVVIGVGDGNETSIQTDKGIIPIRYLDIAHQCGVDVQFMGGLDDDEKFTILKKAKLAILPDYSYSIISMFPLEAVYCGVPCIVPNIPISYHRYKDSVIRVNNLFDTGNWARKIEEVLDDINYYIEKTKEKKGWIQSERSFRSHSSGLIKIFEEATK